MVRHGQASFGTDDYDRLSDRGKEQSLVLGEHLKLQGIDPKRIFTGDMKRQRQTAQGAIEAAGWNTVPEIDSGWNEYDSMDLVNAYPHEEPGDLSDTRVFQRLLDKAATRWASGEHDTDYVESFTAFTNRVDQALKNAIEALGSGQSGVVVSSSGAISWATARLLHGGFPQWLALNRITINSGVTKIISGGSGTTMISFNDHGHLPKSWVTYR